MNAPRALAVSGLERVQVSLPVAGIGYRTLAWLLDALLLFFVSAAGYFVLSLLVSDVVGLFRELSSLVRVLATVGVFAVLWVYWTASETLWRGQTVGKRLLGIRVVRLDGAPVGLFESAVRNLLRVVDFLPALYAFGVLSMLLTEQHRRIGDLVAGTLLIREEEVDLAKYLAKAPGPEGPVLARPVAEVAFALPPAELELLLQFLARANALQPQARERLARAFLARYASGLSDEERAQVARSAEETDRVLRVSLTATR